MKKIAIFGAGGFGREVQMLIEQINSVNKIWEFIGYFDDGIEKGKIVNNYPVIGGIDDINRCDSELGVVFSIGDPIVKKKISDKVTNKNIYYPILIHPNVQIGSEEFVIINEGTIITANNVLTVNIKVGRHVILNLGCTVGHDTMISDFASFMPGVNISGEVLVHSCVYIGTGAKVINRVEIGENTVIGAGAVVAKSLPANCTAVGIPAKPIKFRDKH